MGTTGNTHSVGIAFEKEVYEARLTAAQHFI